MQGLPTYSWMEFWPEYWPRVLVVFLSVIQSFLTFFVLCLHTAIVAIMVGTFTIYMGSYTVGFVAWAFFLASAIASCCVSCCNNLTFGCATYGVIQNLLTFIFSAVLIDENSKITEISNIRPGFDICSGNVGTVLSYFCTIAVPISKALLAVSVVMLLSALAYIGAYIYTLIRVFLRYRNGSHPPNAGKYPGPNFPGEQPKSMRQLDSDQYEAYNQDQFYPMQNEKRRPQNVGYSEAYNQDQSYPMQKEKRRPQNVGYSEAYNQDQSYPMQKEKRRPQNGGYRQAEPQYPMQQEQQRAPKVRYNQGGVSSDDFDNNF